MPKTLLKSRKNPLPAVEKPKYWQVFTLTKKNIAQDLWAKCPQCHEVIYLKILDENLQVCPKCRYHYPLSAKARIAMLADPGSFKEFNAELASGDPLGMGQSYLDKLSEDEKKTGNKEAVLTGEARIHESSVILGVMDFNFRGGSMGSVVGEKVTFAMERALDEKKACIMVTASGGARMQEGTLSLMQMARTSAAVARLHDAGLMYICVLTNPTTAGVAASFAALGDVIVAEPRALVGFTGPRVIQETIRQKLPAGFQQSEFLLEHGMIDQVVDRRGLKDLLGKLLKVQEIKENNGPKY